MYAKTLNWGPDFYHRGNVVCDPNIEIGGGALHARILHFSDFPTIPWRLPTISEWEGLWGLPVGYTYGMGHNDRGAGLTKSRLDLLFGWPTFSEVLTSLKLHRGWWATRGDGYCRLVRSLKDGENRVLQRTARDAVEGEAGKADENGNEPPKKKKWVNQGGATRIRLAVMRTQSLNRRKPYLSGGIGTLRSPTRPGSIAARYQGVKSLRRTGSARKTCPPTCVPTTRGGLGRAWPSKSPNALSVARSLARWEMRVTISVGIVGSAIRLVTLWLRPTPVFVIGRRKIWPSKTYPLKKVCRLSSLLWKQLIEMGNRTPSPRPGRLLVPSSLFPYG